MPSLGGFGVLQYKSFLNFLNDSSQVVANLQPDQNGNIECSVKPDAYSSLVILAMDDNTVSQSSVDLPLIEEKIEKRDLSLSKPLNPEKTYNEMRDAILIRNTEETTIEDITSTDYMIVDSLEKVSQVQQEINKKRGDYEGLSTLSFIKTWDTLSEEEKNNKYSKYMSHEVNFFLYFKDHDYFSKVIKPFIMNKMEKTFVDYWLLGDHEALLKYSSLIEFRKMNAFERCLLVEALMKDNADEAKKLAENIRIMAKSKEEPIESRNGVFDIAINLNINNEGAVDQMDLEVETPQAEMDSNINNDLMGGPVL